jgi:hypothetical protein
MTKRTEDMRNEMLKEISMKKEQLRQMDEENTELVGTLDSIKQ